MTSIVVVLVFVFAKSCQFFAMSCHDIATAFVPIFCFRVASPDFSGLYQKGNFVCVCKHQLPDKATSFYFGKRKLSSFSFPKFARFSLFRSPFRILNAPVLAVFRTSFLFFNMPDFHRTFRKRFRVLVSSSIRIRIHEKSKRKIFKFKVQ